MAESRKSGRPITVSVPASEGPEVAGVYEIHLHGDGKTRVYQRGLSTMTVRRLKADDAFDARKLNAVAKWFRASVDAHKAEVARRKAAEAERIQREKTLAFRFGRLLHRAWYATSLVKDSAAPPREVSRIRFAWLYTRTEFLRLLWRAGFLELKVGQFWSEARWRWDFWRDRSAEGVPDVRSKVGPERPAADAHHGRRQPRRSRSRTSPPRGGPGRRIYAPPRLRPDAKAVPDGSGNREDGQAGS